MSAAQDLPAFGLYARRGEFRRRVMLSGGEGGPWFVGVWAEIDVVFGWGASVGVAHTLRSHGIWGPESGASEDYLGQCFDEECKALEVLLTEIGVKVT